MSDPTSSLSRHKELFLAAREIADAGQRSRFIEEACGEDASLRQRIEAMLAADATVDDFLEPKTTAAETVIAPVAGDTIGYFGDYVLLDEIARGSSGVVFRARQVSLNRVVALKMLRDRPLLTTEEDTRRLRTEATSAASLDHPNIVPIHEVGVHEGQPYFSMKLIEGGTLQFRLAEFQADARKAVSLIAKVARAVHHAHEQGILHRDLKPGNILIDAAGEPHITDFGLARKIGLDGGLTMSGQIMGTPHYMAPEQARGESRALTPGADVYSLGAILYELLEGRRVFPGDDLIALLKQVAEAPVPPLKVAQPDLAAVVMKCLEKAPAARYGTAAQLASDLEKWLRGETISIKPKANFKLLRFAVATTVVILLLFTAQALFFGREQLVVTTSTDELDAPGVSGTGLSLREAVRDAVDGTRIRFDRKVFGNGGVIHLSGDLGEIVIVRRVELDGSAISGGITLQTDADGYRKLAIEKEADVVIRSMNFLSTAPPTTRGGPGGAITNDGTLTLVDCRFQSNGGGGNGGAITTTGQLTMKRCAFEKNFTIAVGGALNVEGRNAVVMAEDCVFTGNTAHGSGGGAINMSKPATDATITLTRCTITGNSCTVSTPRPRQSDTDRGAGGGIRVQAGRLLLDRCIVAGNLSPVAGRENLFGSYIETGPNLLSGDPQSAGLGLGARPAR